MASRGIDAWNKYFKPKFANNESIPTVVKKDSKLYDEYGKLVKTIPRGSLVTALPTHLYLTKTPVLYDNLLYFITFDLLEKPIGGRVTGIRIRPQDFNFEKDIPINTVDLSNSIINDLKQKTDIDENLKKYLILLTRYYSKKRVSVKQITEAYNNVTVGLNETECFFGEILGALNCLNSKIIGCACTHVIFPKNSNEPLIDYYIIDNQKKKLISAKSGNNANNIAAKNILAMLQSEQLTEEIHQSGVVEFMEDVAKYKMFDFPFIQINKYTNVLTELSLDYIIKSLSKYRFSDTNYNVELLAPLIDFLKFKYIPTVGELFYYTQDYVLRKANTMYPNAKIADLSLSDRVTYIKFGISSNYPMGNFILIDTNQSTRTAKVQWRGKASKNKVHAKIGLSI